MTITFDDHKTPNSAQQNHDFSVAVSAPPGRRKDSEGEHDGTVQSHGLHSNNNATSKDQQCSRLDYTLFAMSVCILVLLYEYF